VAGRCASASSVPVSLAGTDEGCGGTAASLIGQRCRLVHDLGRSTVKRLLADAGIEPAPAATNAVEWCRMRIRYSLGGAVLLVLLGACGGRSVSRDASSGGTGAQTGVGATIASGGDAGQTDEPEPALVCSDLGGSCISMGSENEPCPEGTYAPFSNASTHCPSDPFQRCCVPTGDIGSTCSDEDPCATGGCLDERSNYPAGGFCTLACDRENDLCPEWSACVSANFSQAPGLCLARCASDGDCREGWSCQPHRTPRSDEPASVCWVPGMWGLGLGEVCSQDRDCLSQVCWIESGDTGVCTSPCTSGASCVPGFTCELAPACSSADCRFCFPADG